MNAASQQRAADQLRSAGRAVADQVRDLPDLDLSAGPASRPSASRPWSAHRGRARWLVPVAAAVAVIAVAAALVGVRAQSASQSGRQSQPASSSSASPVLPAGAVPRYAAFINLGNSYKHSTLSVVDTKTGKVLATLSPPSSSLAFTGVTGAADDRTFVVDVAPRIGALTAVSVHSWYLLRIDPGGPRPVTLAPLPLSRQDPAGFIRGLALSPDGRTLAVLSAPAIDQMPGNRTLLQTISVATGRVLRSWPGPSGGTFYGNPGEENQDGLSWLANGRQVAFTAAGQTLRVLDTTAAGGSLLAASHPVFTLPQKGTYCHQALLTPDGRSVLCATDPLGMFSACYQGPGLEFDVYSVATGQLSRVLYRFPEKCDSGIVQLVWAGSGTAAIVLLQVSTPDATSFEKNSNVVGLAARGQLTPFRFPAVPTSSPLGVIAF